MEDRIVPGCVVTLIVLIIFYVIIGVIGGSVKTEVTIYPSGTYTSGGTTFEDSATSHHFLYGLVTGEQPDTEEILDKYMESDEQLSKITVTTKFTWVNLLVTICTLGIYVPTTVDIKGEIIESP